MPVPKSITVQRVEAAVKDSMFGTENLGFCLACGADHDACEPDAAKLECYECGEYRVMGAENVMLIGAYHG
jgi:hypothetical protein